MFAGKKGIHFFIKKGNQNKTANNFQIGRRPVGQKGRKTVP